MFVPPIVLQAAPSVATAFRGGFAVGSIVPQLPERHVFAKIRQNTGGSAYLCDNGGDKIIRYNM